MSIPLIKLFVAKFCLVHHTHKYKNKKNLKSWDENLFCPILTHLKSFNPFAHYTDPLSDKCQATEYMNHKRDAFLPHASFCLFFAIGKYMCHHPNSSCFFFLKSNNLIQIHMGMYFEKKQVCSQM